MHTQTYFPFAVARPFAFRASASLSSAAFNAIRSPSMVLLSFSAWSFSAEISARGEDGRCLGGVASGSSSTEDASDSADAAACKPLEVYEPPNLREMAPQSPDESTASRASSSGSSFDSFVMRATKSTCGVKARNVNAGAASDAARTSSGIYRDSSPRRWRHRH